MDIFQIPKEVLVLSWSNNIVIGFFCPQPVFGLIIGRCWCSFSRSGGLLRLFRTPGFVVFLLHGLCASMVSSSFVVEVVVFSTGKWRVSNDS